MSLFINGEELKQQPLHLETMYFPIAKAEHAAQVRIKAPDISGYVFSHWLQPATQGTVISCYIDIPTGKDASIWFTQSTLETDDSNRAMAVAVYCKE